MLVPLPVRSGRLGQAFFIGMSKKPFNKPALTYSQQIQLLKDRGLFIEDDSRAAHILEVISYYRLSGYWYPLLKDKSRHIFKEDASFNQAFTIYCFDRELRKLIHGEIEKVEIAVRAKMIYVLSLKYGPFWYKDRSLFKSKLIFDRSSKNLSSEYKRSDEEFIKAFNKNYSDEMPPSWMSVEITSFGTLSMLYSNLKPAKERREIANHFGVSDGVFESWLHSLVYLRNICAHHSRLWNRSLSIAPQVPRKILENWIDLTAVQNNKLFFVISIVYFLLKKVNPNTKFKGKLNSLFDTYTTIDLSAMNFPKNWEDQDLYN